MLLLLCLLTGDVAATIEKSAWSSVDLSKLSAVVLGPDGKEAAHADATSDGAVMRFVLPDVPNATLLVVAQKHPVYVGPLAPSIIIKAPGLLRLRFLDEDGKPVALVAASINLLNGLEISADKSRDDGVVTFAPMPAMESLLVLHYGFAGSKRLVVPALQSGEVRELAVLIEGGSTLFACAVDEAKQPWPKAKIVLENEAGKSGSFEADASGCRRVRFLGEGDYKVTGEYSSTSSAPMSLKFKRDEIKRDVVLVLRGKRP